MAEGFNTGTKPESAITEQGIKLERGKVLYGMKKKSGFGNFWGFFTGLGGTGFKLRDWTAIDVDSLPFWFSNLAILQSL